MQHKINESSKKISCDNPLPISHLLTDLTNLSGKLFKIQFKIQTLLLSIKSYTIQKFIGRKSMPLPMYEKKSKGSLSEVKHIVAVAAGKGGVGKSSVAVNLALALKKLGYQVGIMDTDIYGPSVRRMLPEDLLPAQQGQIFTPAVCRGIKMLSMAYFRRENEAAAVRAPIANGLIQQFIHNVEWGALDYLLIDFPPGTGDVQLTLSQQAHLTGAVMVTTPQEVALMDVRKAMHLFEQVHVPIIGIIENMSGFYYGKTQEMLYIFGKGGGVRLAKESGVPFLGDIPLDPAICLCGDTGDSLFDETNADTKHTIKALLDIAEQVVSRVKLLKEQTGENLQDFKVSWKEMPQT